MRSLILTILVAWPVAANALDMKAITKCDAAPELTATVNTDAATSLYMLEVMKACPGAARQIIDRLITEEARAGLVREGIVRMEPNVEPREPLVECTSKRFGTTTLRTSCY